MEIQQRNIIVSCICGLIFGVAWWMMIDIVAVYTEVSYYKHGLLYLPICFSSISLFLNGAIPNSSLTETSQLTRMIFVHRFVFFLSTALGFTGLLAAIIICAVSGPSSLPIYALVGIPIANFLILISNICFKFCVVYEEDEYF